MRALLWSVLLACGLSGCHLFGAPELESPAAGPEPWHVTCESDEGHARHCAMDTSRGVQLASQLSQSPCVEGNSWGYDDKGVWVDHGCRADFSIATPYGDQVQGGGTVRCESDDGHYRFCRGDMRGGAVLLRQLSNTPCIEDRSWGTKPQGVWVNHGCRAEFGGAAEFGDDDEAGGGYRGATHTVRCESDDGRPHRCDAAARGARLQKQISNSRCIQGETWGWDPGGVWVTAGCRGDFAVW
jgi:hypothetical protein